MKTKIAILTMLTRPEFMDRVALSIVNLNKYFAATWHVLPVDPCNLLSMGAGLNALVAAVDDYWSWCIIVDDDNIVHPMFGKAFQLFAETPEPMLLLKQYLADGKPRIETFNPIMQYGRIDAAQIAFRADVARRYPFPNVGYGVDGRWAELLRNTGFTPRVVDVPVYYNFLRP